MRCVFAAAVVALYVIFANFAFAQSSPVPVNAVGAVGTILSTGGWTHEVPLELPPAPGGLVPSVALVADHRVQDGPLGTGWRLDGFSRLERRGPKGGVPQYGASDTYWVDGMRLWPDPSGLAGHYRLEVNTQQTPPPA